jgi:hypothetical protein
MNFFSIESAPISADSNPSGTDDPKRSFSSLLSAVLLQISNKCPENLPEGIGDVAIWLVLFGGLRSEVETSVRGGVSDHSQIN